MQYCHQRNSRMKGFFLLFVVFVSFGVASLGFVYTSRGEDVLYANRKIKYLAEILSLEKGILPERDTIMVVPSLKTNKALVFLYNKNKELSHLGVSLFSHETKNMLDNKICNFLERFFLELLLQGDKEGICFKLKEYHSNLWIDGQDYTKSNMWTLTHILNEMEMPVNFGIKHKDGRANAVWTFGTHKLLLDFPLYRELIEGMDKKESDYELYNQIQGAAFKKVVIEKENVDERLLTKKTNDIYVLAGEKYRINELSSDKYYIKKGNDYLPVFHSDYPEFSLNNLFLTYTNGDNVTLKLTHRQYGHFTPEISMPLINFLDFLHKDFTLTCHTGYDKKGKLETIVVMNHNTLDYIHLLRVHVSKDDLFKPNLVLLGDFYSNIPQHYIKTLLK